MSSINKFRARSEAARKANHLKNFSGKNARIPRANSKNFDNGKYVIRLYPKHPENFPDGFLHSGMHIIEGSTPGGFEDRHQVLACAFYDDPNDPLAPIYMTALLNAIDIVLGEEKLKALPEPLRNAISLLAPAESMILPAIIYAESYPVNATAEGRSFTYNKFRPGAVGNPFLWEVTQVSLIDRLGDLFDATKDNAGNVTGPPIELRDYDYGHNLILQKAPKYALDPEAVPKAMPQEFRDKISAFPNLTGWNKNAKKTDANVRALIKNAWFYDDFSDLGIIAKADELHAAMRSGSAPAEVTPQIAAPAQIPNNLTGSLSLPALPTLPKL